MRDDLATSFTALCKAGRFSEAKRTWYASDVDGFGEQGQSLLGLDAILADDDLYELQNEGKIHAVSVTGPFPAPAKDDPSFGIYVTWEIRDAANVMIKRHAAFFLLTVYEGKIIREEIFQQI